MVTQHRIISVKMARWSLNAGTVSVAGFFFFFFLRNLYAYQLAGRFPLEESSSSFGLLYSILLSPYSVAEIRHLSEPY